jgi:hypothetical protein
MFGSAFEWFLCFPLSDDDFLSIGWFHGYEAPVLAWWADSI